MYGLHQNILSPTGVRDRLTLEQVEVAVVSISVWSSFTFIFFLSGGYIYFAWSVGFSLAFAENQQHGFQLLNLVFYFLKVHSDGW